jgi:hypothetical protein
VGVVDTGKTGPPRKGEIVFPAVVTGDEAA